MIRRDTDIFLSQSIHHTLSVATRHRHICLQNGPSRCITHASEIALPQARRCITYLFRTIVAICRPVRSWAEDIGFGSFRIYLSLKRPPSGSDRYPPWCSELRQLPANILSVRPTPNASRGNDAPTPKTTLDIFKDTYLQISEYTYFLCRMWVMLGLDLC